MYQKSIPMSYEQAAKIASDLLDSFQLLFDLTPVTLSTSVENAKTKFKTFRIFPDKIFFSFDFPNRGEKSKGLSGKYNLDIVYRIIRDNRCFEITLFDDPDALGYCSMLPDYDPSTYVIGDIVEKRANGTKKYEMTFGFDIEKRTFLELFEITHHNTVGILREYPDLNSQLEADLKNVVIIL